MSIALPFDTHYLLLSLFITIVIQWGGFIAAYALQSENFFDLLGAANFILLGVVSLVLGETYYTRQIIATAFLVVSRGFLGGFLLFRACKRGGDARFDELKSCPVFFFVWTYQIFWVYVVCSPVFFLNGTLEHNPALTWSDYLGMVLWGVGFLTQSTADIQKYIFRANPDNKKKFCDVGLWKYSRHPPYFGEILQWWGLFSLTGAVLVGDNAWGYFTILSPLFTMFILLCSSGIPLAEGKNMARWYKNDETRDAFDDYFKSTPPLILFPPVLYRPMPLILKRVLCFELPMYAYRTTDEYTNGSNLVKQDGPADAMP